MSLRYVGLAVHRLVELGRALDPVLRQAEPQLAILEVDPLDRAGRDQNLLAEDPGTRVDDDVGSPHVIRRLVDVADVAVGGVHIEPLQVGGVAQPGSIRPDVGHERSPPLVLLAERSVVLASVFPAGGPRETHSTSSWRGVDGSQSRSASASLTINATPPSSSSQRNNGCRRRIGIRSSNGTPMIRPAAVARRSTRPASDARNRRTSSAEIVTRRGVLTVAVRVERIATPYPLRAPTNRRKARLGAARSGQEGRMARLRRSTPDAPGIARRRHGRGFTYIDPSGARIDDEATLARIRALAIPPAWEDVWICADPDGHLQATGSDAAGRRQYRYHDVWRERRDRAKFRRLRGLRRGAARPARAGVGRPAPTRVRAAPGPGRHRPAARPRRAAHRFRGIPATQRLPWAAHVASRSPAYQWRRDDSSDSRGSRASNSTCGFETRRSLACSTVCVAPTTCRTSGRGETVTPGGHCTAAM